MPKPVFFTHPPGQHFAVMGHRSAVFWAAANAGDLQAVQYWDLLRGKPFMLFTVVPEFAIGIITPDINSRLRRIDRNIENRQALIIIHRLA